MEEIKIYLEGEEREYAQGIYLLTKFGKNRQLALSLSRKENPANRQKLEYELSKLATQSKVVVVGSGESAIASAVAKALAAQGSEVITDPAKAIANTKESIKDTPLEPKQPETPEDERIMADIITQMSALYHERCKLSNTLADQETDEKRKAVVDQLDAIQSGYNALAEKKKHFEQTGKFPEAKQEQPATDQPDKAELLKKRNNLRSQVSKAKKAADAKPDDTGKQEKLQKLLYELDGVELHLKYIADQEKQADETVNS